jgi:peptide chain release factor 3
MVIDVAKGIESQTQEAVRGLPAARHADRHLHQQGRPREARPYSISLDEIADLLALDVCPMTWPVGMGGDLRGHLRPQGHHRLLPPEGDSREFHGKVILSGSTTRSSTTLLPRGAAKLREEVELARGRLSPFDAEAYRDGDLTPVYFGSALKDYSASIR